MSSTTIEITEAYIPGDPSQQETKDDGTVEALTLYVFVKQDLRAGKAVSQAGHAIHSIVHNLVSEYKDVCYESLSNRLPEHLQRYLQWCKKPTKVALKATDEQLMQLATFPEATAIIDEQGDVNVRPSTLVCVAFRPRAPSTLAAIRAHHRLL